MLSALATALPVRIAQPLARPALSRLEAAPLPGANVPFEAEGAPGVGRALARAGGAAVRPWSVAPPSTKLNSSAWPGSSARSSYRLRTFPRLASSRRHVRRLRCLCLRARRNQIAATVAMTAIATTHGHPLQAELP